MRIIGREREKEILEDAMYSGRPEFVAVYGRRRVGKTYLIREFFRDDFVFQLTGVSGRGTKTQLDYFCRAMNKYGKIGQAPAASWADAFESLSILLERTPVRKGERRIVFLDELSWLDSPRSEFLPALEHFWNTWGAAHPDFMLIVCGSAASWFLKKLFRNRGGLHNRVTRRIRLLPFNLTESEAFFQDRGIGFDRKQVAEAYMVFGGIPFYLNLFFQGRSVAQNVDMLCFGENAPLNDEFGELYHSLFRNSGKYIAIIQALHAKQKGMTRDEIIDKTGISSGGGLTDMLEALEQSGFIYRHDDFSGEKDRYNYRLVDFFSSFYLQHMRGNKRTDSGHWANFRGSGAYNNWIGYRFEVLCLLHVNAIKNKLGIPGVSSKISSWRDNAKGSSLQIDLVIDRNDGVIDLCEMKYSSGPFAIDKTYAEKLTSRRDAFLRAVKTKKTIHHVLVATDGLARGKYSHIIDFTVTLDDLY